ncbi:MAG TPA: 3-oxoadipate enol-lactonase [Vineibacter sp.]|nr:3-oxoadipate enol-lactonase [Vineibacter sp.]
MLLTIDGHRVYYDMVGPDSAPIVCFTHSLSSDGGMWQEQVPILLGAGFRVLRLDMRGHGGSDPVAGDYTMSILAGDVIKALDALGIDKVHYIGLSIGGMIGQALLLDHGERLLSAMLCDTQPSTPPGSEAAWDERKAAVRLANGLATIADGTMDRWFTPAFKSRNPARWTQIRDTIVGTTPQGFLGCAAAIQNFNFENQLHTIKVPTLVVCGDQDPGTPPDRNKLIASKIPGGRYEEIKDARHLPNVEHPDVFNPVMVSWLRQNR